jgi:glutamine transport system substrate-binding protein
MFKTFSTLKNIVLSAAAGAALLAGSQGAAAEQTLRVATEPTFPPFEFVKTETNQLTGFEVDLVNEIAKELGAKIEWQVMGFDAIIPAIRSKTVQMGAAGFSVKSGLSITTMKENAGKIKSMKDLEGKKIGVQLGTTSQAAAMKVKGAKVVKFNSAGEALLDMSIGGSYAVINDRPVTSYILTQQPKLAEKMVQLPETYTADDFAFVFDKSSTDLQGKVNAALKKIKDDGRYGKISEKWFGKN